MIRMDGTWCCAEDGEREKEKEEDPMPTNVRSMVWMVSIVRFYSGRHRLKSSQSVTNYAQTLVSTQYKKPGNLFVFCFLVPSGFQRFRHESHSVLHPYLGRLPRNLGFYQLVLFTLKETSSKVRQLFFLF